MKKFGIFTILCLLIFSSCREDINIDDEVSSIPPPNIENFEPKVETIVGDITGFVIDENGEPVIAANVTMDGDNTTTDDYGHFFFTGKSMNKLGALVKVEKEGYFKGSRRFFPNANQNNRVKIQLLTNSFDESFNTADGGTVSMTNGVSVGFTANSISTDAGVPYTGTVKVAMKWMDPSQIATLAQMPGNLQGLNAKVEEMALATYGMIAVELEGESGEALNITSGMTATISLPVPEDLLSAAPPVIPLWSYNEEHGLWVEESIATLQNGVYVGEVSHFSFWNLDEPFDSVNLDVTLVDDNGNPLDNYLVKLTLVTGSMVGTIEPSTSGSGWTDANGNVSGAIPANEELTLEVIGVCEEVLFSTTVGPYSVDAKETISTSVSTINNTIISGVLLDCDGNPVTNGLVIASFNGATVYRYTDSNFSYTFTTCGGSGDVIIIGIDLDALEQGPDFIAPAGTTTDLGSVSACGNSTANSVTVTIGTESRTYVNAGAFVGTPTAGHTMIGVEDIGTGGTIAIAFEGLTTGDYSMSNIVEMLLDDTMGWEFHSNSGFSTFDVTQYDTKLKGTAGGELIEWATGNLVQVDVSFNITL